MNIRRFPSFLEKSVGFFRAAFWALCGPKSPDCESEDHFHAWRRPSIRHEPLTRHGSTHQQAIIVRDVVSVLIVPGDFFASEGTQ